MDYKNSCSSPTFDFTIVYIKHHPVKVMDLEIQAQCLWGPCDMMVQAVNFETPWMSTPLFLHGEFHGQEPGGLQSMEVTKTWAQLSNKHIYTHSPQIIRY